MTLESIRAYCMSLPHATEQVQWGDDLVFKIGGKMFAVLVLEASPRYKVRMSFKCSPENFAELTQREGIIPAPYSAKHGWVAAEAFDTIAGEELKPLLRQAYDLVFAKLTKKAQNELPATGRNRAKSRTAKIDSKKRRH